LRNIAQIGRREVEEHRRTVQGITAERPRYAVVDQAGHKEWVVDVYLGPPGEAGTSIARNCPIAPIAHDLVTDVRMPVLLEKLKQGKLTVVGRSKFVPAGAQTPNGSILEPTYHEIEVNLAALGLLWIADLDYQKEKWGEKPWGEAGKPFQSITITDAWGHVVSGPDVDPEDVPAMLRPQGERSTTTKHTLIRRQPWGAFRWGRVPWGSFEQKPLELTE
jgi:hypothetical protein